jgi:FRG domain
MASKSDPFCGITARIKLSHYLRGIHSTVGAKMAAARYEKIRIESWRQFRQIAAGPSYRSWAFRGQSDANWKLLSTLSRYLMNFNVHKDAWPQQESRILRIFRRKAHLFLQHIPDEDDSFQWLALMQHHGAPTRLLDFTWSPYVAAFFALERATANAAVWALFPPWLYNKRTRTLRPSQRVEAHEIGPWVKGNYEKYFLPNEQRSVIIGEPHRMNQRIIAQSGTFVIPGVLDTPLDELAPGRAITKFILVTSKLRKEALAELYKMNISHATLFPDIDGLARSLAYELEFHWAFDPATMKKRRGYFVE